MKLAVKNVKVCKWASEETLCFEAVVTIDGVPCIHASNDGHGGSTMLHDFPNQRGSVVRLMNYAKTLPVVVVERFRDPNDASKPFTYDQTADTIVDGLVNDFEALKEMRRALKRGVYFKSGGAIRYYAKRAWEQFAAHPVMLEDIKRRFSDAVWLNDLPEADAFAIWNEAAK